MKSPSRMHDYRKHRHRSARRRKGLSTWKPGWECRGPHTAFGCSGHNAGEGAANPAAVLEVIARRLSAYPGVRGILCTRARGRIELTIVAPPPMTAPLSLLVATWQKEMGGLCPNFDWRLHVVAAPRGNLGGYRCLFWRDP